MAGARVVEALVALSVVLLAGGCAIAPDRDVPGTPATSGATPAAQNGPHRERQPLEDDAVDAARDIIPGVVVALDGVRTRAAVTPEAVVVALEGEGLSGVQTRADGERMIFGAVAPGGGCIYGEIRELSVQVEVGGLIPDAGCLPAP